MLAPTFSASILFHKSNERGSHVRSCHQPAPQKSSTLIRRFLPYMAKYRGVLAFDLFCAALTTLCDIALPSIMRTLTNTVSAAALTVDTVLRLAALYFVLRIIDGAASYFMSGIGHIMGVHIETDMRRDAFDHLLRLDHIYYNNTRSARSWAASPTTCSM